MRLKSGYVPSHWEQPGKGDRWDQGYDVTAWFLDYLNGLRNGCVADLISFGVTTRPSMATKYDLWLRAYRIKINKL